MKEEAAVAISELERSLNLMYGTEVKLTEPQCRLAGQGSSRELEFTIESEFTRGSDARVFFVKTTLTIVNEDGIVGVKREKEHQVFLGQLTSVTWRDNYVHFR